MGELDATSTSVVVADGSIFPEVPFLLTFGFDASESETVLVTENHNSELVFVRGIDGGPFVWVAGTRCARIFTAKDLNDLHKNFEEVRIGIGDAKAAAALLLTKMLQRETDFDNLLSQVTIQTGQITLTNSMKFPFNNSEVSINLPRAVANKNYLVDVEVISHVGNVGEVVVSGKLINGFKLAFTGSASQVVVKYVVIGGTL